MIKNKVFVTQENSRHDYKDAQEFGEIVFMFNESFNFAKAENSLNQKNQMERVEALLTDFDPRTDYVLLSGCPVVLSVVSHLCLQKANGETVRFLKFSSMRRKYEVVNIKVR